MKIKHIMKDGVIKTDISGIIVQKSEVRTVYSLIEEINKRGGNNNGLR